MSQVFPLAVVWHQHVIHSYLRYSVHSFYWPFISFISYIYINFTAVVTVCSFQICFPVCVICFFWSLFLQTYGSGNLKRVGVILQRGVLILLLACFPCWAILINTQPILLAVRQSPEVARWVIFASDMPSYQIKYHISTRALVNEVIQCDFAHFQFFPFFRLSLRLSQLYVKIFMPALPVSSALPTIFANCYLYLYP